jgi:hypothetical protein
LSNVSQNDAWSPDSPSGADPFEQGDEAFDDRSQLDPDFLEAVELDPSLDPNLQGDERELEEAGARLEDPEAKAVMMDGMDDPDGIGERPASDLANDEDEGWDLDAPLTRDDNETDTGSEER